MRTTVLLSTAMVFLWSGCTKHECDGSSAAVDPAEGSAKTTSPFVYAVDGGQPVTGYQFSIHCGPLATTDGSGKLMFGGSCTNTNQVGAAGSCFERNQYYWLIPPGTSTSRQFLRFKFLSAFDPTTFTTPLVRYEPSTFTWSVPNGDPNFEWAIYDTRKRLPACQGAVRQ
ncbi:MAG: hypothetical protein IPJ76_18195 [Flavobacteriales bacterium]|nr:MAG: hypothetical protein IPJ76_18195 [Flavobacteriales bacterium]